MAVVQEMYIGNTHIIVKDDYIVSIEEQAKILKKCGEIAARQYIRNLDAIPFHDAIKKQ